MATFSFKKFLVKNINPPAWLRLQDVQRILSVLNGNDGEIKALIVGGAVRNELLGKEVADVDIASSLTPEQVMEICAAHDIKTYPTGLKHGTVTAHINGRNFEITTLRRDEKTDGRHAVVAYTADWREDAARRDFTMNALYMDSTGGIYDFLGDCLADAQTGNLRFVGNAKKRIEEDALRIMRFFRFYAYYGVGQINEEALAACAEKKDLIKCLSKERITAEFKKIIVAPNALQVLNEMERADILGEVIGGGISFNFSCLDDVFDVEIDAGFAVDITYMTFLAHASQISFEQINKAFILSNTEKKYMHDLLVTLAKGVEDFSEKKLRYMIYGKGRNVAQAFLFFYRQEMSEFQTLWAVSQNFELPVFPVNGKDLLQEGFSAGVQMGRALDELKQSWEESDFTLSKAQLLKKLDALR
jgi:poly(A) polymerase